MLPYNYIIDTPSPIDSFMKGVDQSQNIQDRRIAQQNAIAKQQQAQAQAQAEQEQQMQMRQELANLAKIENPTAQDYARVSTRYPALADNFKKVLEPLSEEQRQNKTNQAVQIYAALNSGRADIAKEIIDKQIEAAKNSGDKQAADGAMALSKIIEASPANAKATAGLFLSVAMGPEKFGSANDSLIKAPVEAQKAANEITNLQSQIAERAARLNLDKDKLQTETELKLYELDQKKNTALKLDSSAEKIINESAANSVVADQSANSMRDLASRLEKSGGGYGAFSSASEWLKNTTGNQDAMSELRREYLRIRNSQVMSMLPPGSASDKDIDFAKSGFPSDNSDTTTLARFLKGLAKIQEYAAVSDNMKAEWVNEVGNLGKTRKDTEIDGVKVPAGTSFAQFAAKNIAGRAKNKLQENNKSVVQQRGYMKYAQPVGGE